jgi:hypothetical protein
MSQVEVIVQGAKDAFTSAKSDGKLEVTEVIHIALDVAKKVYLLGHLSEKEQLALLKLCLKKGLVAAGGLVSLPAFVNVPVDALDVLENQILQAGLSAVNVMKMNAPAFFAPLKNFLGRFLPGCTLLTSVVKVLDPKDSVILKEALELFENVGSSQVSVAPSSVSPPSQVSLRDPLQSIPETEPNPVASP